MIEKVTIKIVVIIVHHIEVQRKNFRVEIEIDDDHDQGKNDLAKFHITFLLDLIVGHRSIHVVIVHVHAQMADDIVNVLVHGKFDLIKD